MEKISVKQLYELFLQTLDYCGMFLLECKPHDIECYLFEEFDSDSISYLHQNSLEILLENEYISTDVYDLCKLLHERFRKMEGTNLWNAGSVKNHLEWHFILKLSDTIKGMVSGKAQV